MFLYISNEKKDLHCYILSCSEQTEDRFNLEFHVSNFTDFVWTTATTEFPKIDSSEVINFKYPICFEASELSKTLSPPVARSMPTTVDVRQSFQLCLNTIVAFNYNGKLDLII